jgi:hypothetical protein
MKIIGYWCGFMLYVSAIVWLFLDAEKARPVLQYLFCGSFYIFIASYCLIMIYKGSVHLQVLEEFKKQREPNGIKEKMWSLFFILFDILVVLIVAAVAGGALRILYCSLKAQFQ